jgi:hypothetical protein
LCPFTKLEKKLDFCKVYVLHHEFNSFLVLLDENSGDIKKCDIFILYNEMCQHLKDLHDLVI